MTKQSNFYVYILTNYTNTTLYTGVSNNLISRTYQHKNKLTPGFSSKYNLNKLVYYEIFDDPQNAIFREKQIKAGSRSKKLILINQVNPSWNDLYDELI